MSEKQLFTVLLEKHENMDATGIAIPWDVEKVFGAKRVPVKVTINGAEHRSTIVKMGGKYVLVVPKIFREAANVRAGGMISVCVEKDLEKRTVKVPQDLADALKKFGFNDFFDKMSVTHQKEYVRAVEDAKKPETRLRKIEKTIRVLAAKNQ